MTTTATPQQILQSIMAQMAQSRGANSMSGLPGQPQPGMVPGPSMPAQPLPPGSPRPPQAGIPGAAQPQTAPSGASSLPQVQAPQRSQLPQGNHVAGLVLGLVNSHQQKDHDKKAALASGYYTQISDLLATDPNTPEGKRAHEQAQLIMDDPKIRKMLYEGLNWKPLEEEPPPEAVGVQSAIQKQQAKQQKSQPWQPQGKAILPPTSQAAQMAQELARQKIATEQAQAGKFQAEGQAATDKVDVERQKMLAQKQLNEAQAIEAKGHAKWYEQQAKESEDLSPVKKAGFEAGAALKRAQARENDAKAKFWDRMPDFPGKTVNDNLKASRSDMIAMLKGYISDNNSASKDVRKDTGYILGPKSGLVQYQQDTKKLVDGMQRAIAWFDGEGSQAVRDKKMTVPQAMEQAYKIAGVTPPPPGIEGEDTGSKGGASSVDDLVNKYGSDSSN